MDSFYYAYAYSQSGSSSMPTPPFTLVFTGSLTVSQSEAVQASLLEALTEHASVEIDCSDVEDIDVSFLQILISASQTALAWNKNLRLSSPPSELLSEAITRCGFPVPASCMTSIAGLFSCESAPQ
jgi:anti-anti-sigma regulatory factor